MSAADRHNSPWPREGDDPLGAGTDWRLNACLNFWPEPWGGYAEGYKLAGHYLVEKVEATGFDHDFLVYPIMGCYRQFIELALKGLIRDSRLLLDEKGGAPKGHSLMNLLNTARPLLLRIEPKLKGDLDNAGAYIQRFEDIDPTSQVWRYPVDTDGNPSLPKDLFHINLRQVREVVERLGELWDAVDAYISELLEYKAEELAEAGMSE